MRWCVYLLRCGDGTLYAGVTTDVDRRLAAHRQGRGARYTRGRGPLELVHLEPARTRSAALRREHELKCLRRAAKLLLFDSAPQRRHGAAHARRSRRPRRGSGGQEPPCRPSPEP